MPKKIEMVATRAAYVREDRKEYQAGQKFSVSSDADADRLERRQRAVRAAKPKNSTDLPKPASAPKVTAQTPSDAPAKAAQEPVGNEYRRRDLTAQE